MKDAHGREWVDATDFFEKYFATPVPDYSQPEPPRQSRKIKFWCEGTRRIRHKRESLGHAYSTSDRTWSWGYDYGDAGGDEGEHALMPGIGYVPMWKALWEAVNLPQEQISLSAPDRLDERAERLLDETVDKALSERGLGVSTDLLDDSTIVFKTLVACPNKRCKRRLPFSEETLSSQIEKILEAIQNTELDISETHKVDYDNPRLEELMGEEYQTVWTLPISLFTR